jgi:hypothetical protein
MIPDVPCAAEVLCKLLLLSGIWIKAEFVCLANHRAILAASPWDCRDPVHSLRYPSLRANFMAKRLIELPWRSCSAQLRKSLRGFRTSMYSADEKYLQAIGKEPHVMHLKDWPLT